MEKTREEWHNRAMKILIDALGGDNAPQAVLEGAANALKKRKDLQLIICGPQETCQAQMKKLGADLTRVEFLQAEEAVLNTDHPAMFLKAKPNSSLAVCYENLRKREDIDGMISAGPTGAVLTGAVLRLGRIPGIERPALLSSLPTKNNSSVRLIDSGANMDCKPQYLYQFGLMASVYLECIGYEKPRISLLNVGSEEGKGDELSKEAFALLKNSDLNFIGNIEGDHVLDGTTDIVVCDGFAGNVFLKGTEGACYFVKDLLKNAVAGNFFRKIGIFFEALGAIFQVGGIKQALAPFKVAKKACAPLLGTKKLVVKTHGKSSAKVFEGTILETCSLAEKVLLDKIEAALPKKES